jgi:hypothetical protein
MDELIAFAKACLDEDEAAAKEAASRPLGAAWDDGTRLTAVARHINRHDPARVLREVAAKRAIIGQQTSDHAPVETIYGLCCRTCVDWQDDKGAHEFGIAIPHQWPCRVARSAVASWADRPGYRPEWAPEGEANANDEHQ